MLIMRSELVEAPDFPAPVQRIFGETVRSEELLRWEDGSTTATFEYTPETMADRVSMCGRLTTEPLDDGRCRVIQDIEVTVKLFGIAGMVERLLAKELPLRHEKAMWWLNANLRPR